MTNIKMTWLCAKTNFYKWWANPRIYMIGLMIIAFMLYHMYGFSQYAVELDVVPTPWIFPHVFTPPVLQLFACFTLVLFCDAPFADKQMPFLMIRAGRRNWIIGQIIYILLAAFIFTIFIFIVSILVLLPKIQLSMEWGIYLKSLGANFETVPQMVTVFIDERLISMLTPFQAITISLFYFWLVSVFIGIVSLFCNIVMGKFSGLTVIGILISISYFAVYFGSIQFGEKIAYISPISWMSISTFDWTGSGGTPSPSFALIALLIMCILLGVISMIVFCKKDVEIQDWGDLFG